MQKNLFTQLNDAIDKFPGKVALQGEILGQVVNCSYQDLGAHILQHAQVLQELGVAKGDRVIIMLENGLHWVVSYFAIVSLGAIAVPIDSKSIAAEIDYLVNDCGAKFAFIEPNLVDVFADAAKQESLKQIWVLGEQFAQGSSKFCCYVDFFTQYKDKPLSEFPEVVATDVASIVYTAGTTGGPKGVMLTHANFLSNYSEIGELNIFDSRDNILALLPLHHSFALMVTMLIPLLTGASVTFVSSMCSEDILRTLQKQQITALVGVPEFFYLFADIIDYHMQVQHFLFTWLFHPLLKISGLIRRHLKINFGKFVFYRLHRHFGDALRNMLCSGAPITKSTVGFFFNLGFTFIQGYGLSEATSLVTLNLLDEIKLASLGRVLPNMESKIANPNQDGIGEVLIKGGNIMLGYWQNSEATTNAIRDNWFYSGDLGKIDKDGYLYLCGRKNELLVFENGKTINPEELEHHYLQSKYIQEICVLKVGANGGEKLVAVVVPNMDYFRECQEVTLEVKIRQDLKKISAKLANYQRVLGFTISQDSLPRTHLGTLRRFLIANKYAEKFSGWLTL